MPFLSPTALWMNRAWSSVIDFCFPALCPYCEHHEAEGEPHVLLCRNCQHTVQALGGRQCQRCSASVGPHVDTTSGCVYCREERFAFEQVCSLGPYRDSLRSACLRAKMKSGNAITMGLAQQLGSLRQREITHWKPELVIPVPHHWWEQLRRPHTSASALAETLAKQIGIPARFDLLLKIKTTEKQASLPRTKRKTNLKGAFGIGGGAKLGGTKVLLVDDILTSGATAHECAKVLKQAGASQVYVAVIARTA